MRHMQSENAVHHRLRGTLERLLGIDALELESALDQGAQVVAEALDADKVDAFVYEAETESLVALGTSDTPMGRRQHEIGLHRLALANGGRAVQVFRSGQLYRDGHVEDDPDELAGIKTGLGIRSIILCPLDVAGERRGVLAAASGRTEHFSDDDLPFLKVVARWLALVMHRAELVEQLVGSSEEKARRDTVLELVNLLTPRQREVAALIACGNTNEQIAQRLVLTPGTVANHVEHILRRLSFRSRSEVAALAGELGLHRQGLPGDERTG